MTNQALKVSSVLNQLNNLNMKNVMIIGDECHHHNTDLSIEKLPKAVYRLGLSATPYHHINEEHNININSFYKKQSYEYSLKRAIKEKILTPYKYYVHKVEPSEKELDELIDIQKKLSKAAAIFKSDPTNLNAKKNYNNWLGKKIILLGTLENKTRVLKEYLKNKNMKNILCSMLVVTIKKRGSTYDKTDPKVLSDLKWNVTKFTGDEKQRKERKFRKF